MAQTAKYISKTGPKVTYDYFQDGAFQGRLESASGVKVDSVKKEATVQLSGEDVIIEGYPFPPDTTTADKSEDKKEKTKISGLLTDTRLNWNYSAEAVASWNLDNEIESVEGMLQEDTDGNTKSMRFEETADRNDLKGVASIMNPHAYLILSPTNNNVESNKLLSDTIGAANADGKLWYETGLGKFKANEPTTTNIINWSHEPMNVQRSYKFSDFAFCKYWKKIPNNYLITLRRYPFPVNDSITFPDEKEMLPENKMPVSTMVTWLGEDPGNSINSILTFEAGMNWGEVKSDLWEQQAPDEKGSEDTPFGLSGIAKGLGLLSDGVNTNTQTPLDPYDGGPYANKIIGPIDVIQRVAKRERGLIFKQNFSLVFEYSGRSVGGANTKAIMMDIMGNMLLMSTNAALFWGGQNRMKPGASPKYPFLGGKAGLQAFYNGDAAGWFGAITDQFSKAFSNVGDIFGKLLSGDFASVLSGVANTAVKQKSAGMRPQVAGIRSLLTGDPVGEWHMTVGNPLNPMIVAGNLVCKGIKVEFNEEMGPDDFPTEIKCTITLEHGMDRDRDRIQSMFNYGSGRFYGLPKGYESTFSSASQTNVDKSQKKSADNKKGKGPIAGDKTDGDRIAASLDKTGKSIKGTFAGIMSMGEGSRMSKANT